LPTYARSSVKSPLWRELLDQVEIGAVVHVGDAAAIARFLLALRDHGLARAVDGIEVRLALLAARAGQDPFGDLVEPGRNQHAVVRVGRQFCGAVGGDVAVADQVAVGPGVVLDHAERDMVVGQHQSVLRHERAGGTTDLHHRAHRRPGEFGQIARIALEPSLAQLPGDIGQLRWHPHALVGVRGGNGGQGHGQAQGQG